PFRREREYTIASSFVRVAHQGDASLAKIVKGQVMKYRPLGKTGFRVSEIGFGCGDNAGLIVNGTAAERREVVERALAVGINYFDTADHYGDGKSERNLGETLREIGAHSF